MTTYTINDAITAAKVILKAKGIKSVSVNPLKDRSHDEVITLEQLNTIQDELVADTLYWESGY